MGVVAHTFLNNQSTYHQVTQYGSFFFVTVFLGGGGGGGGGGSGEICVCVFFFFFFFSPELTHKATVFL